MRATKQTLGLLGLVFLLQLGARVAGVPQHLFSFALPLTNQPWTVLTNIYAHNGFSHLFANSLTLVIAGLLVERVTTTIRFHAFFISTGVIAALAETVVGIMLGTPTAVVGASGAIFALMGYAIVGNEVIGSLFTYVDLGRVETFGLFTALAVVVTLATAGPGVALVAHAVGLFCGLLAGYARVLHV